MEDFIKQIFGYITSNPALLFPWLGFVLVSSVFSEIVEQTLINVRPGKPILGFIYPRRLQALLPILIGLFMGFVWKVAGTIPASCMYFATAGVVSLFTFDTLKKWLASKGWDIEIPGLQEDLQRAHEAREAESMVKDAAKDAKEVVRDTAKDAQAVVDAAAKGAEAVVDAAAKEAAEMVKNTEKKDQS